jgi:exopolysaccharide biosynthesis polyprenyl glycosylphosphotransferase
VIGDKNIGPFIHKIESNTLWGFRIKGIITDDSEVAEKYNRYPIYTMEQMKEKLLEEPIDEVFYCLSNLDNKLISNLVYLCLELGITFRVSSQTLSLASAKSEIYYLGESPFFTFQNTPRQSINLHLKNIFDKIISFFALICLLPIFLIVAIAIKIDSKGPVFFKQTRSGLRGREFTLYKFRSMCDHAEEMKESMLDQNEQEGPVFKIKNDKRITRVGKFIRKTSIDEIPQFFNVLKGDMSIVGPRPPLPAEVKEYKPWQTRKLSMKPGLTCIWQVSGRNKIPFEQWMKLDLQYIDTWSLGLDCMIILKTFKAIFQHDGQ